MSYTKIEVKNPERKENIASYLRRNNISYRYMQKLKQEFGNIKLNGKKVFADQKIKDGDIIEILNNTQPKSDIKKCILPLDVVYEDEYILIINKPAGLACMPTKSQYDHNLAGALMYYMEKKDPNFVCRIINRLDKEACGIVLVAKNSYSASFFNANIDAIKKVYHAICSGKINDNICVNKKIATLVDEDGRNQMKRVIDEENGLEAQTYITPIKYLKSIDSTLIKVQIVNGRTHQIRLHTSSIDHALLGDKLYGSESNEISHTALLCKSMQILHPFTNKLMNFEVDYPSDFKRILIWDKV